MAVATKPAVDAKKLREVKARMADIRANHDGDINKNHPVSICMGVFKDHEWLIKQVERLTGLPSEPAEDTPEDSDETE